MPRKNYRAALLSLAIASGTLNAYADTTWQSVAGDWSNPANWSSGLPASGGNVYINNAGTAQITAGAASAFDLYLGQTLGQTGSVILSAETLVASDNEYIGYSAAGTFSQTGGNNLINSVGYLAGLFLGYNSGSTGAYQLGGSGSLSIDSSEYIGYSGIATFTQSGGTHTIAYDLTIGNTGTGAYILSGPSLLAVNHAEHINGSSVFSQSDGSHTIADALYLGTTNAGPGATYILSNSGNLSAVGGEFIGYTAGTGLFNQSAGFHTIGTPSVNHNLYLAYTFGATTGIYNLSDTGSLVVNGLEYVGWGGVATFNQTGGTHTVSNSLNLGATSMSISGGTFVPAGSGFYRLNGSAVLAVSGSEYIGNQGFGSFSQTGGIHTVGTPSSNKNLYIAYGPASLGTYTLAGSGSLTVNGSAYVGGTSFAPGGTGILDVQNGTMTVTGTLKTWNTPATAVKVSGGVLQVGSLMDIAPATALTLSGSGCVDLAQGDLIRHSSSSNLSADYITLRSYLIGHQIRSSSASPTMGLGLMKATDFLNLHGADAAFAGQTLAGTDLLIKFTYLGDADLDGSITVSDYAQLDAAFLLGNFNAVTKPASWVNGDFNYDGKIDYQDFAVIDYAFQNQSGPLAADIIQQHAFEFGTPYLNAEAFLESGSVPEPASLGLLGCGVIVLLKRRPRSALLPHRVRVARRASSPN